MKTQPLDPKENIIIKGAKLHNLKNIDVVIPRNKLVVITGLSGSGKSSLAFDTLYAEGQRRYVESLSSYARQFLGRLNKPKVDSIKGISPAIAIEQKVNSTNPRSTVGTSTEIYDYLKLLFARIGKTYSPVSNLEVKKDTVSDVIKYIKTFPFGSKLLLLAPIVLEKGRTLDNKTKALAQQGFARVKLDKKVLRIDELKDNLTPKSIQLVIDRVILKEDEDFYNRLADAIQMAFYEGKGTLFIEHLESNKISEFNNRFERDGMTFTEPNVHLFSFNNPFGACPTCEGYGDVVGVDQDLVIPNTSLSIYENAIFPWRGDSMGWYRDQLVNSAYKFDFPIHKPWFELTKTQQQLVWDGNEHFEGLHSFFKYLESKSYKIQNRVMLSRYRGKTICASCNGNRLKAEVGYVKIANTSIQHLVGLPLEELAAFFKKLQLDAHDTTISKRLLVEINNRLSFLLDVGLSYLTLNRKSNSLSGGESQRINLATSLGSSLVGSMYILDEPSIGLHPKDTERLIKVLKSLRDLGNTVIVVEHDEDIMKQADHIIDIGPEAGSFGGEVVATGTYKQLLKLDSLTAGYLNHTLKIEVPKKRRTFSNAIEIKGAREHNLQNIDATFPIGLFTAVTGVSGSGKSTIANLITRFYDVNEGSINIDSKNIKEITQNSLRKLLGLVTQDSILFNDTVKGNLLVANQNASDEEIIDALKIANAWEFVELLPKGIESNIGDSGNKLSGGQKQRLSIARAVLKNPPIMILDEATSALDSESEQLVQNALENMMKNRTSIVIAHRLSTIQKANNIVVLSKGKIVEQGKHQELLEKKGVYFKLVKMQSLA